jgi:hypothetical protein
MLLAHNVGITHNHQSKCREPAQLQVRAVEAAASMPLSEQCAKMPGVILPFETTRIVPRRRRRYLRLEIGADGLQTQSHASVPFYQTTDRHFSAFVVLRSHSLIRGNADP